MHLSRAAICRTQHYKSVPYINKTYGLYLLVQAARWLSWVRFFPFISSKSAKLASNKYQYSPKQFPDLCNSLFINYLCEY